MTNKELWTKYCKAMELGFVEPLCCRNHSYIDLILDHTTVGMVLLCPMEDFRLEVGLYDKQIMFDKIVAIERKHGNL